MFKCNKYQTSLKKRSFFLNWNQTFLSVYYRFSFLIVYLITFGTKVVHHLLLIQEKETFFCLVESC